MLVSFKPRLVAAKMQPTRDSVSTQSPMRYSTFVPREDSFTLTSLRFASQAAIPSPEEVVEGKTKKHISERMSLDEYLNTFIRQHPEVVGSSFHRFADMIEHWGAEEVFSINPYNRREKVYLNPEICRTLERRIWEAAHKTSTGQRIISITGPKGSAKTTMMHNAIRHLELWSKIDKGAVFTFEVNLHEDPSNSQSPVIPLKGDDGHTITLPAIFKDAMNSEPLRILDDLPQRALRKQLSKDAPYGDIPEGGISPKSQWVLDRLKQHYTHQRRQELITSGNHSAADIEKQLSQEDEEKAIWDKVTKHISVVRFEISKKRQAGVGTYNTPSAEQQDAEDLFGTINFKMAEHFGNMNHPAAFEPNGVLGRGNRGVVHVSEGFKLEEKFLNNFLDVVTDRQMQARGIPPTDLDEIIFVTSNPQERDRLFNKASMDMFTDRVIDLEVGYTTDLQKELKIPYLNIAEAAERNRIHINYPAMKLLTAWILLTRTDPLTKDAKATQLDRLKYLNKIEITQNIQSELEKIFKESMTQPTDGMHGLSPRKTQDISTFTLSSAQMKARHNEYTAEDKQRLGNSYKGCIDINLVIQEIENFIRTQIKDLKNRELYRTYLDQAKSFALEEMQQMLHNNEGTEIFQHKQLLWENYCQAIEALNSVDASLRNPDKLTDPKQKEAITLLEKIRERVDQTTDHTTFRRLVRGSISSLRQANSTTPLSQVPLEDKDLDKALMTTAISQLATTLQINSNDFKKVEGENPFCGYCLNSSLGFVMPQKNTSPVSNK